MNDNSTTILRLQYNSNNEWYFQDNFISRQFDLKYKYEFIFNYKKNTSMNTNIQKFRTFT